ncbi:MAG: MFS transporter [Chloroflexi bacterium]|nr:MFS transporter [Chloroflexota bacterium]
MQFAWATGARFLGALQYRDYRTMWYATMAAGAAAWALIVARGALAYDLSGSSLLVGVVTFSAMAPQMVVPFFAGYMADRFDRRKLLAWSFAINVVQNLALAALVFTDQVQVWHMVALSLVNGVARAVQMPTSQSLVPNLVPKERLLNAVALNSATMQASRLMGPLLIVPLLATVDIGWSLVVCALLYCYGLAAILRIKTQSTGSIDRAKGAVANFLEGFSYIYTHPVLLAVVLVSVLHCALTMSFESMLPGLARERLGMGQEGFALLMMADGAGALVIVVTLAGIESERTRGKLLLWLGLVSGLAPMALAASGVTSGAWASMFLIGASQAGFMTLSQVLVQYMVPDSVRGRASGIYTFHVGGMMAVFNLVNGALAEALSVPLILTVTGGAFVVIMGLSLLRGPLRQIYASGLRQDLQAQARA